MIGQTIFRIKKTRHFFPLFMRLTVKEIKIKMKFTGGFCKSHHLVSS